ncbi:universal stress protein [Rhodococcus sp. IEGM 1379]|uniref:universal stress protein n=1 Tax=Rhodococcus sp. IEGM 1379 TaxID=3047086 RepID=UPI0024B7F66A|nr:universal stress protein [Rhodococcus sp. IEGM 1379]MDI9916331.1 universal stress protein [Rhodococcus sp. IEGM 1379]
MTVVAGYAPDSSSIGTIQLATLLARSFGEPLVVCSVISLSPQSGMTRVDAEEALTQARATVPADIDARYVVREAHSTAGGLLDVVHEHDAKMIILDSSSAGVFGRVALGSVTSRLLHSSDVPVALAPKGFRAEDGDVVRRVTAAYAGTPDQDDLVLAAATVAARVNAGLRLASFAVRSSAQYPTTLGTEGDWQVVQEWVDVVERETSAAFERVRALPQTPDTMEAVVGHGRNWDEVLDDIDWDRGDVLTVGSSQAGPIARVFLGSRAAKIVRYSPVPVVVVPRSAATRIIDRAESE